MNPTQTHTATILGVEGRPARVLVSYTPGEGRQVASRMQYLRDGFARYEAALHAAGVSLPEGRYLMELDGDTGPTQQRHLDLPAAVALCAAAGALGTGRLDACALAGDLGLDGTLHPIDGSIVVADAVRLAGLIGLIVPAANSRTAAAAGDLDVRGANSLAEVIAFLAGRGQLARAEVEPGDSARYSGPDLSEVKGQEHVKRALEVAAAGGHHVLMVGPPGSGKTMLAQRIPGLLPPLSHDEALEVTRIHSVAGTLAQDGPIRTRPFRQPEPTISAAGLVGGAASAWPGEAALAHLGVLLLDEVSEFRRLALDALRAPIENRHVTPGRDGAQVSVPADFMLVAAMNPCPCGHHGDTQRRCTCTPTAIQRYLEPVRGPILNLIDIHVEVPAVRYRDISDRRAGEPSAAVRERVLRARSVQRARFAGSGVRLNSGMGVVEMKEHCAIGAGSEALLRTAITRLGLSARAYHRVLKIARTIADLDGGGQITTAHVSEAIQYRSLDRAEASATS